MVKQKKKVHHSRPHRSSSDVMRDMHGVARFHRTGNAMTYNDMSVIIMYIARYKFNIKNPEWYGNFIGLIDSYWYRYINGQAAPDDFSKDVEEFGCRVSFKPLTKDYCQTLYQDPYLKMVAVMNLERNNEVLKEHTVHLCAALLSLHDIGWKDKTVRRFEKQAHDLMETVYAEHARANLDLLQATLNEAGIFFEQPEDWFDDPFYHGQKKLRIRTELLEGSKEQNNGRL